MIPLSPIALFQAKNAQLHVVPDMAAHRNGIALRERIPGSCPCDPESTSPQSRLDWSGIPKNIFCRCLATKYAGDEAVEQQCFALPQQPD